MQVRKASFPLGDDPIVNDGDWLLNTVVPRRPIIVGPQQ
jgi:hypothetical protein